MSVPRLGVVLAALSSVLMLVLTACSPSSDDEPSADPTPEISVPSSTTSTTPKPKPETAKEFIRRWREASDEMQNSGTTAKYLSLTKKCTGCKDFANTVTRVYEAGGHIEFAGTTVLSIRRSGGTAREPEFDVNMRVGQTTYVERKGAAEQELPGGSKTYLVTLTRANDQWLVTELLQRDS